MNTLTRIAAFGSAGLLIIAGVATAVASGSSTSQFVAFSLIGLGLVAVVSMVFLEVGLSEDRERANAERKRARRKTSRRPVKKLGRSRGERRRLS